MYRYTEAYRSDEENGRRKESQGKNANATVVRDVSSEFESERESERLWKKDVRDRRSWS